MFDPDAIDVPAAIVAEQRVAPVRGRPDERLALLRSSYAPPPGTAPVHLRYQRAALAFMGWQVRRRRDATGMFLSVSRVLPNRYPLDGDLETYIADEHALGRLLDLGVITPRLTDLYRWSAAELRVADLCDLVRDGTPAYAWDYRDAEPWRPPPGRLVRAVRRIVPPRIA